MPELPKDGTRVEGMTYESIEYDRPSERVVGILSTHPSPFRSTPQCWVGGIQVMPETVRPVEDDSPAP